MELKHHRKSPRWDSHDYSTCAVYFITACTKDRQCIFGNVDVDTVRLSPLGRIVDEVWRNLREHHPMVSMHEMIVMPNHIHSLIELKNETEELADKSISIVVSAAKAACTRLWRIESGHADQIWQRSFHDEIIRSEKQFDAVRKYIQDNPIKWHLDQFHPDWRIW